MDPNITLLPPKNILAEHQTFTDTNKQKLKYADGF